MAKGPGDGSIPGFNGGLAVFDNAQNSRDVSRLRRFLAKNHLDAPRVNPGILIIFGHKMLAILSRIKFLSKAP
jgi:hypothetical protein